MEKVSTNTAKGLKIRQLKTLRRDAQGKAYMEKREQKKE